VTLTRRGPRLAVLFLTAALTLSACQDEEPQGEESPQAEPSPTGQATPETTAMETCTNTSSGYSIDYPENWTISTGEFACRWADPESFVVEPGTEGPSTAIMVFASPDPFDRVVNGTFDELFYRTNLREDTTINGRRAVRFEVVATGEGLGPDGTPSYGYVIDKDGMGFTISTERLPGDTGYDDDKKALEEAVKSLKFFPPED
jgi:hypothetical protein